jgi:hypothetical protein
MVSIERVAVLRTRAPVVLLRIHLFLERIVVRLFE